VDECFLESFRDNVFGILPNSCVTERECENPSPVTLGEAFKTQFISFLGGGHEYLVCSAITGGSNGPFANLVSKLTQHDASPVQWAHALEPVRLPLLKLRANHSPNPGLRKSLIFGGTSAWKSKKSEKSKMSNRLTFEFAVKVRKSTIRELQASRRELLVQLAHKTYEPAREKAEERG
jgi:hypothetical protein